MTSLSLWILLALPGNLSGSFSAYGVVTGYRIPVSLWPTFETHLFPGRFVWSRLNLTWEPQWGSAFSGKLAIEAQPMTGDSWSIRYFEMSFDQSRMHSADTLIKDTHWGSRFLVYRASIQWMLPKMRIRLGRMLVSQGLTYVYSPLDFYVPRQRLALDPEFLPGMDAVEVTLYPVEDLRFRWVWPATYEGAPASASLRFWAGEWEILILGTRKGFGAALSRPVWQGIFRAEGFRDQDNLYGSVNYDRFFAHEIYALVELFWPPKGNVSGFTPFQAKKTPYGALLLQKTINPLWTASVLWVYAINDQSFLVVPGIQYAFTNSATLELRADLAWGDSEDIFDPDWFRPLVLLALQVFF